MPRPLANLLQQVEDSMAMNDGLTLSAMRRQRRPEVVNT